jgi:hypothetical protein
MAMYEDYHRLRFTVEQKAQLSAIDRQLDEDAQALVHATDPGEQQTLMARMHELADARAQVMELSEEEIAILNDHPDWEIQMYFDSALEDVLAPLELAGNPTVSAFGRALRWKLRRFSYHALYRLKPDGTWSGDA